MILSLTVQLRGSPEPCLGQGWWERVGTVGHAELNSFFLNGTSRQVRLRSHTPNLPPTTEPCCSLQSLPLLYLSFSLRCTSWVAMFVEMPSVLRFLQNCESHSSWGLQACVRPCAPTPLLTPAGASYSLPTLASVLSPYCLYLSLCSANICFYLSPPLHPELVEGRHYAFFTLHDRKANVFKSMTEWVGEWVGGWVSGWINNSLPKMKEMGQTWLHLFYKLEALHRSGLDKDHLKWGCPVSISKQNRCRYGHITMSSHLREEACSRCPTQAATALHLTLLPSQTLPHQNSSSAEQYLIYPWVPAESRHVTDMQITAAD